MPSHDSATVVPHCPDITKEFVRDLKTEFERNVELGNHPAALELGRKLIRCHAQIQDSLGQAATEICVGKVLLAWGRAREAASFFLRAKQLLRSAGTEQDLAGAYFNLGRDFGKAHRLSLAMAAFRHSANIYLALGEAKNLREAQVCLASTALLQGNLQEAEFFMKEASPGLAMLTARFRIIHHETEVDVFLRQGKIELAEEALICRYRVALELGERKAMADSFYRLAVLSHRRRDAWAAQAFIAEAQACIAGLGHDEAEARLQDLLRETVRRPKSSALSIQFNLRTTGRNC